MSNNVVDITVLIAFYNNELTLQRCLKSIHIQTANNWECVLIDDCSTDKSFQIAHDFTKIDPRFRLFKNQQNLGLARSLNLGLLNAKGKFIARMDADDISLPHRLQTQYEFLKSHDDIDVLGSNAIFINRFGQEISKTNIPIIDADIKKSLITGNPIIHPSVMMTYDFLVSMAGYHSRLRKKQDYDMWVRGSSKHHYSNLEEPLIKYTRESGKPLATDLYGLYVRTRVSILQKDIRYAIYGLAIFIYRQIKRLFSK